MGSATLSTDSVAPLDAVAIHDGNLARPPLPASGLFFVWRYPTPVIAWAIAAQSRSRCPDLTSFTAS